MTTSAQDTAIAGVQSAFGTTPTQTDSTGTDSFLTTLQNRLMGMSSMVSSDSTSLESAISASNAATTQGAQLIESKGNREIAAKTTELGATRTNFLESGRGFAVNTAALRQLDESTDKSLKDMEQRKQELILENNIAGANRVSDLQVKAEEFRQKARQDAFSNILQMGNFAIGLRAEERAASQFRENMDFQKKQLQFSTDSKITDIATEFGVAVLPGDTLASISKRVQPFASAKRRAEMAKLLKDTETETTKVNTTGYLTDALMGTGIFSKEQGGTGVGMTSASAALSVANYMKQLGLKVTGSTLNDLTAEATKLKEQQDEISAKVKAEEEGNQTSFLGGIFGKMFGGGTPRQSGESSGKNFSSIPDYYGEVTPQTSAFISLFQR